MKIFVILYIIMITNSAHAGLNSSFFELSAGVPNELSIENPDATNAYYEGMAFKTQFHYNLGSNKNSAFGVSLLYKYLSIENTKISATTETGIHKGAGVGVFTKFSGFYLGINYSMMSATHETTGAVSGLDTFSYTPMTIEISYTVPYGSSLEYGPSFSYTTADISADETGLTADAPYSEQILWFKLLFFFKN